MVQIYKLDCDISLYENKKIGAGFFEGYLIDEKVKVAVKKSSKPFHEAELMKKYSNEAGLVKFYGTFQSEIDHYLVFEYFCCTLEDLVEKKGDAKIDEIRKKELVHEIAKAIHFLHTKNICK